MGCASEAGCFGPKKRDKEVYISLLQKIHEQALKFQSSQNLNIYRNIREKIVKKGLIRKLLDNLASHRNKVHDCLNQNSTIVMSNDNLENRYAGLIVVDEVIAGVYKNKKKNEDNNTLEENALKTATTDKSKNKLFDNTIQSLQGSLLSEIDSRFEFEYFRLINFLLENQGRMLMHILDSINAFAEYRTQKFTCPQIWKVLEFFSLKIQKKDYLEDISFTYSLILRKLKENLKDEGDHQKQIIFFFKLWMKQNSLMKDEINEASEQKVKANCINIITEYVNRCLSNWDTFYLYRAMLAIYDENRFSGQKIFQFEDMIIGIVKKNDLHYHFLRGMFFFFLEYLSNGYGEEAYQKDVKKTRLNMDEFNTIKYKNLVDKNTKMNGFKAIRRWIQKQYIDFNQIAFYNSLNIIHTYSINIDNTAEYQFSQQLSRQLFKITGYLNQRSNQIIISELIEEIKENAEESSTNIYIHLIKEIVEVRKIFDSDQCDTVNFFICVSKKHSKQIKIEILQLVSFFIKINRNKNLNCVTDQNNSLAYNISQFFFALYENLIESVNAMPTHTFHSMKSLARQSGPKTTKKMQDLHEILFKHQFSKAIIGFTKSLIQKKSYSLVLGFLDSLVQKIQDFDFKASPFNKINAFFIFNIIFETIYLINSKQRVPDKIKLITLQICSTMNCKQTKKQIENFVQKKMKSQEQLQILEEFQKGKQIKNKKLEDISDVLNNIKKYTMVKEQQYQEVREILNTYFKPIDGTKQERNEFFNKTDTKNLNFFKRQSLNASVYDSINQKEGRIKEEDQSFVDIMDRILDAE